ncbi:hypothetical protein [Carboxylicivirga caseinilyticus]|uniref:hypothetical protein n=1 Tax=Carboxylicivirga caseinilyticus TaxID=3417572 RepID=UPI003D34EB37|nr:hypothetical protein [Marinilabiliaceae bacterium A049]
MGFTNDLEQIRQLGLKRMNESSLVICSIVRDCGRQLQINIPVIEKLRSNFLKSAVIVVENDSVDDTKTVLANWKNQSDDVHVIGEDTQQITIPRKTQDGVNPFYSRHRIEKMSRFRNMYLDHLDQLKVQFDYMMVIDLDINYFDVEGIIHSFAQNYSWDALVANGTKFLYKRMKRVFHDTYALREVGDERPQTEMIIESNRIKWNFLKKNHPLIPVASGFNGLAIYKFDAVKGCRYMAMDNNDAEVQVLCEHVAFHQQMIQKGNGKIFINPRLITRYREDLLKEFFNVLKRKN